MKLSKTAWWCLLLGALVLLFYWKFFVPRQYSLLVGQEDTEQAYSWFNFWIRTVRSGHLPVWDQFANAGYCFPGEMQTGAFYPLYLLLLLLPLGHAGLLSPLEYHSVILFSLVLAALFMFALGRELRMSRMAACFAGLCFSLGGFVGRVHWPHMLGSAIWLPLILLFFLRAFRGRMMMNLLLGGTCLGMSFLAGGLHIVIAQGIAVAALAAFLAVQDYRQGGEDWRQFATAAGVILLTGVCAGAVQLFPSHQYAGLSLRWYGTVSYLGTEKPDYMYIAQDNISPSGILSFLFPLFSNMGTGEVWPPYAGAFAFILAVIAVARNWQAPMVRFCVYLAAGAVAYSFAGSSLLHGVLYALVPWLWMAREATRFLYLAGFSVALLAGIGLDLVLAEKFEASVGLSRGMALAICASLAVLLLPVLFPSVVNPWVDLSCVFILAAAAVLRFRLSKAGMSHSGFAFLLFALTLLDLYAFNNIQIPNVIVAKEKNADEFETLMSLRDPISFLHKQQPPFRVKIFRDYQPNIGDAFGMPSVFGAGVTLGLDFSKVHTDYDLLNTRYFIRPSSAQEPDPIYADALWKIYENPAAFPRAWLVHQTKLEPSDGKLYQDFDLHKTDLHDVALLRSPAPIVLNGTADPSEAARVTSLETDHIRATVHARTPGLLVFSEINYPEWQATVNGHRTPILRTDGALRSVPVPAGDSVVEMTYRPWTVYLGGILSMATFLAAFVAWFRNRHSPVLKDPLVY